MERQMVVFELSNEHYGVDIGTVESIIKMQAITVVPHAPSFVEGVTNLRGNVLPVINLRNRFHLTSQDETKNTRIVVVAIDNVKVGMIVDAVSEVLRVPEEAIEPPPPMVTSVDTAFITAIAKMDEKLVILLDLREVLSVDEKVQLEALAVPA
jgi:purine-binding chemotaxis protein CheW